MPLPSVMLVRAYRSQAYRYATSRRSAQAVRAAAVEMAPMDGRSTSIKAPSHCRQGAQIGGSGTITAAEIAPSPQARETII